MRSYIMLYSSLIEPTRFCYLWQEAGKANGMVGEFCQALLLEVFAQYPDHITIPPRSTLIHQSKALLGSRRSHYAESVAKRPAQSTKMLIPALQCGHLMETLQYNALEQQ